jgi:hypothetical protein
MFINISMLSVIMVLFLWSHSRRYCQSQRSHSDTENYLSAWRQAYYNATGHATRLLGENHCKSLKTHFIPTHIGVGGILTDKPFLSQITSWYLRFKYDIYIDISNWTVLNVNKHHSASSSLWIHLNSVNSMKSEDIVQRFIS